jgi:preprotein translocase subunit SecA
VRLFAGDRIFNIMNRFKLPDDQPMEAKILSNQIENAQKRVEEQNFVARKNVLKYDDVLNVQRQVIYEQRRAVLEGMDLSDQVDEWIDDVIAGVVAAYTEGDYTEEWDLDGLVVAMQDLYGSDITLEELREEGVDVASRESLVEEFVEDARDVYASKVEDFGSDPASGQPVMRELERFVILQVVDTRWREHLDNMDYLREGVHLRAMAQKDPLVEYRGEGHAMFEELGRVIHEEVVHLLFHAQLEPGDIELERAQGDGNGRRSYQHEQLAGADAIAAAGLSALDPAAAATATVAGSLGPSGSVATMPQQRVVSEEQKLGRNDPCWCGSGKKFKKCHGA